MTPAEVLLELNRRDVRLSAEADRLRYEAPPGALTAELLDAMRKYKPDLLCMLAGESRGLTPGARVRSLVSACPGQGVVLATGFRSGPHGTFAAVRFDDGLLAFVAEDYLETVGG
jgi:hypothetical protein